MDDTNRKPRRWTDSRLRVAGGLLAALIVLASARDAAAQQSFQQRAPWQRRNQPRGRSGYYGAERQEQFYRQQQQQQAQSHYLDDENWMTDKRSRLWDVRLDRRSPNKYSWTSRIVLANGKSPSSCGKVI